MHSYDMRIKNEIYSYRTKHEFAKKCLRYNLPFLFNNIPAIVNEKLNTQSTGICIVFKKQNYQVTCTRQNCYIYIYTYVTKLK